ncbi:glycosyltransferase family 2 protein [Tropicimonas sp. TH_r6]|uniref:glycosyltransferase family 2 protein n=1 Tax=Tropicimonas sp. TH_r6 TaxID=3082085 RepID=UPI0029542779|nr:glycosyltransferase family 2 protein [Tropicimonas sp. TH_r6]MDV7145535.1 glycosyltransferase family 2 protein [Tropicimonas sp. TH_r6]
MIETSGTFPDNSLQEDTGGAPEAAIIIPHYNDHVRLERCLSSLSRNDLSGTEVVVVDNGSDPDPAELVDRFPFARLLREDCRGAAAARNRGVAGTTAPILMFLDADCVPAPDWVVTGKRLAQPDTIIGGRVDVFTESADPMSGAEAFETVFAFNQKEYVERKRFSVTANLVASRALFDRTGDFIVGLSEDFDWCHRALATGADIVYADDLAVAHPARTDWVTLKKKWRRLTEEGFALNAPGARPRLAWAAKGLAMVPSIVVHSPKVLRSEALATGRDRRAALLTLTHLRLQRAAWMFQQALRGQL